MRKITILFSLLMIFTCAERLSADDVWGADHNIIGLSDAATTTFGTKSDRLQMPLREYRAVWLTTYLGLDWPKNKAVDATSAAKQQADLCRKLDLLKEAGINTVIFQVRTRGLVTYPSDIEPFDGIFTGKAGVAPPYDPLLFALQEVHKRGMEFHAWLVSFPVCKVSTVGALGNRTLPKKYPELCQRCGDEYMLDPGIPATGEYLARICREVAEKYDVDGIHLDYIRYPEKGIPFDDAKTYKKYGTGKNLADWRRENVTGVVRKIHDAVKAVRPSIKLSCAPVGKYADLPHQSSRGWNARDAVFQDAALWLNEGWMDVLFPMMYFDGDNYYPFAKDWKERCGEHPVVPGLGIYFLHPEQRNWSLSAVQNQMNFIRETGLGGYAFFRSNFFTEDTKGLYTWTKNCFNERPALPPSLPNSEGEMLPPTQAAAKIKGFHLLLSWKTDNTVARAREIYYNVYRREGENLIPVRQQVKAEILDYMPALPALLHVPYAITAVDQYGNESRPVTVTPQY